MFITKAKLEWLEDRIKKLEDNYWFLAHAARQAALPFWPARGLYARKNRNRSHGKK